ncbi:MAG: winged helix DNA-binding protein, partial [Blautia sp.]|nr:winged helix DNA-binding protein [Blautia sp.]
LAEELGRLQGTYLKEIYEISTGFVVRGEDAVLLCLYISDRPLLSGELVTRTGLTSGRIANILKSLEKAGMIVRISDRDDRRMVHVKLTDKGTAFSEKEFRDMVSRQKNILISLGEKDGSEFVRLIKKFLEYIRQNPECIPQTR